MMFLVEAAAKSDSLDQILLTAMGAVFGILSSVFVFWATRHVSQYDATKTKQFECLLSLYEKVVRIRHAYQRLQSKAGKQINRTDEISKEMERGFDHLSGIGAEIAATILHVKLMFSKDDVETLDREVDSLVELTMRQSKISSLVRQVTIEWPRGVCM